MRHRDDRLSPCMTDYIYDMASLCDFFCADVPARLNRRIYKDTACGASISVEVWIRDGWEWVHCGEREKWNTMTRNTDLRAFTIQAIVEGSGATVDSDAFTLPVSRADVDTWIEDMQARADGCHDDGAVTGFEELWHEANDEGEENP